MFLFIELILFYFLNNFIINKLNLRLRLCCYVVYLNSLLVFVRLINLDAYLVCLCFIIIISKLFSHCYGYRNMLQFVSI